MKLCGLTYWGVTAGRNHMQKVPRVSSSHTGNNDLLTNIPPLLSGYWSTNCLIKSAMSTSMYRNPKVRKQRLFKTFPTVNHAKVLWDSKMKPRGLFGGHFRSIASKSERLLHLLSNSDLDFLCISETVNNSHNNVFMVSGCQWFRQGRTLEKVSGGGLVGGADI